ncbi:unnamed protein product [Linum trigynum]|uniref:Uncharacterized protein n=1 Tax=Linum trigynum TaxID=586398 RepID=A0AAV2CW77_9ROSI
MGCGGDRGSKAELIFSVELVMAARMAELIWPHWALAIFSLVFGDACRNLSRDSPPASGTACLDICVHHFSDNVFFGEKLQTDDVTADGTALAPLSAVEILIGNQRFGGGNGDERCSNNQLEDIDPTFCGLFVSFLLFFAWDSNPLCVSRPLKIKRTRSMNLPHGGRQLFVLTCSGHEQ